MCFDAAATTEVKKLKAELEKAQQEDVDQKATAEKATAKLGQLWTVSNQHEARVSEVPQELTDAVKICEDLEQKGKEQATKLASLKVMA